MSKLSKRQVLVDGLRLKCPKCRRGDMFANLFKMNLDCSNCGFKFEREPGYFVGAMYINYGATVFIAFGGYFALDFLTPIPFLHNFTLWIVFSGLFPAFFFRYSRSLWLSFDYMVNPSQIE